MTTNPPEPLAPELRALLDEERRATVPEGARERVGARVLATIGLIPPVTNM